MTHDDLVQLLTENGYDTGWALNGENLSLWQHDADPPAPLTRPEASNDLAG